jgi:hypothetical protein
LIASPFAFSTPLGAIVSIYAFVCGAIVVVAGLLSFRELTRHARAVTAAVGLWLAGRSYWTARHPADAELQNQLLIGMLLIMFAIIPNEASKPPTSWRRFVSGLDRNGSRN